MGTLHFIWWGLYRGDDCVRMPNAVALACPGHQIRYWCKETEAVLFKANLDDSIDVRSCSSVRDVVGALYDGEHRALYDAAQDVLVTLDAYRAFSAVKDLLELVILHTQGGYYLDTTTLFPPGDPNGATLHGALSLEYDQPRIVGDASVPKIHQILLQTAVSIITGTDGLVENPEVTVTVDRPDVWAMYAPQANASVLLMLRSYVSRCNRMGINPADRPSNVMNLSGTEILRGDVDMRDELIGQLVIRSVLDGLLVRACDLHADRFRGLTWPVVDLGPDDAERQGRYALPALGVNKRHVGSWRSVVPVSEESKSDAPEEKAQ